MEESFGSKEERWRRLSTIFYKIKKLIQTRLNAAWLRFQTSSPLASEHLALRGSLAGSMGCFFNRRELRAGMGKVDRVMTYIIINSKLGAMKFQKLNPNKPSHL